MSALAKLLQRNNDRLILGPALQFSSIASCNMCSSSSYFNFNVGRCLQKLPDSKRLNPGSTVTPAALVNYQPFRNAGHSKWANIKHVKMANDMARQREINKFMNLMRAAAKEGGSFDPKQNSKLAVVIQQFREAKLPMAAVDRFLQSTQAKKDCQNCIYPVRGPGNCIMLIDIEAPSLTKVKQEINTVLKKNKGTIADNSVVNLFDHKGILCCSQVDGKAVSEAHLDDAMEHAIEAGANDVAFIEDHPEYGPVLEFVTEPSAFLKVKGALEKFKYNLVHADLEYIPHNYLELEEEEIDAANKLYEKITEHPDVQKIFVNIA